ncbi:MAG: hypothetical protein ACYS0G_13670 [Planctomycetota bacterium]|jgi:hypothetical protein
MRSDQATLPLEFAVEPYGGGGAPGDLDGDGVVGIGDLLILLANWG